MSCHFSALTLELSFTTLSPLEMCAVGSFVRRGAGSNVLAGQSSKHFLISIVFPPIEGRHPSPCPTPARYFMPRTMMAYFLVKNVFCQYLYTI